MFGRTMITARGAFLFTACLVLLVALAAGDQPADAVAEERLLEEVVEGDKHIEVDESTRLVGFLITVTCCPLCTCCAFLVCYCCNGDWRKAFGGGKKKQMQRQASNPRPSPTAAASPAPGQSAAAAAPPAPEQSAALAENPAPAPDTAV
eukprot:TRINITY_DN125222_c0_g1_i1.p1 TRINITY_DN125222_c0_g1~~TRINITY_DN125222_c0_g1_i1.p1  ORF type:complete len:149 (-),score=24.27 TRINITY_DN125222_c0_g1_i1:66-512(-)